MDKKRDYVLPISILIAGLLIAGALIYSTGAKYTPKEGSASLEKTQDLKQPQIKEDNVILGDPNAPVTLFVFSDYQCPFCGMFFEEVESLIRENYVKDGKVKMVYKTLAFLGPESEAAAQAAECAKDQGRYWQYHDALFEEEIKDGQEYNGNLNKDLFKKIASDLKMDVNEFLFCFDSQKYKNIAEENIKEASLLMDRVSTPTIFVNDKMIQGAYPYETFSQVIDEALNNN